MRESWSGAMRAHLEVPAAPRLAFVPVGAVPVESRIQPTAEGIGFWSIPTL